MIILNKRNINNPDRNRNILQIEEKIVRTNQIISQHTKSKIFYKRIRNKLQRKKRFSKDVIRIQNLSIQLYNQLKWFIL